MKPGGPKKDSSDNHQFGLQYGIVTQNKDTEGQNRIKVRLPWLDKGDTDQTHWAQLSQPMEGDKFGWYILPDVDDAVVVMFIKGDMSQPVILGGSWSKPDNSPEPNEDGKNNFRGYRSRSGHRMILDDTDKTKVVVVDKSTKIMIGVGQFEKAGAGPNTCDVYRPPQAETKGVSLSSMEGTFEITCKNGTLKIDAEKNITLNSLETFDMKAGQDLNVTGTSVAKLTSGSPSNYDAPKIDIA